MEFIGILGDRGSFKSCFMTSRLAHDARQGRPIIANYQLYFPPQYPVLYLPFEQIAKLASKTNALKNASIGFEELGIGADSYDFFESQPRAITEMIAQLRKDRAICYYNDQRFNKVAKRLRDQTDGYFLCEDVDRQINPGPSHRDTCKGIAHITQLDGDMDYMRDFYFDGKPWYSFYNTDEKQHKTEKTKRKGAVAR